jgi:methionine-gamma-lyase
MTKQPTKDGFATRAIHFGYEPAGCCGSLTPPIFQTATYAFDSLEDAEAVFRGERSGYVYGRTRNPTQNILEERLASLEEAQAGLAMASGMAAISSTMLSLLQTGDRVLIDHTLYGNSFALFMHGMPRFGIFAEAIDFTDLDAVEKATKKSSPKVIFCETPGNPTLRVLDISAISVIARSAGALFVVDNTFATPALQQPIRLGADLVVHSATKYIGGHGDLVAGAVLGSKKLVDSIRREALRCMTGATMSPFTAFLLLRGLKTLELRMQRHCSSALTVARMLEEHPAVATVFYPGLESSRFHGLAARQMSASGGLLAFELHGGKKAAVQFINNLALARRAVSLGDAETLVQHPASMTHATYTEEERERYGIRDSLVRISVGLETPSDIENDIQQALHEASKH